MFLSGNITWAVLIRIITTSQKTLHHKGYYACKTFCTTLKLLRTKNNSIKSFIYHTWIMNINIHVSHLHHTTLWAIITSKLFIINRMYPVLFLQGKFALIFKAKRLWLIRFSKTYITKLSAYCNATFDPIFMYSCYFLQQK